jgi:hypothetical protein
MSEQFDLSRIAEDLYKQRVRQDRKRLNAMPAFAYQEDAKKLYMMGVRDALTCLRTWTDEGVSTDTMTMLLCQLHEQSKT